MTGVNVGFGSLYCRVPFAVTLSAAFAIANVRVTAAAGRYATLPPCDAVTSHDPAPVMWTFEPTIVQSPAAAYETARPEDAVAPRPKSDAPYVLSAIAANVIVCSSRFAASSGPSGSCQTYAPRLRVQTDSVVAPRSIDMS